jgi:hypothetical protein
MANTAIPITVLVANSANLEAAGTAIVAANTHTIDCAGIKAGKLLLRLQNTFAGSKVFTIKAAANNPPGFRGSIGDLVLTLATGSGETHTVLLETARFVGQPSPDQTKIYITVAAATTGFIWAYQLPLAV